MAQGDFTKQEAQETIETVKEIMEAMGSKAVDYIGHFNDVFLFLEAARRHAPDQEAWWARSW